MKRAKDKGVSIPVQEMRDIKERLAHMDELGIDVQVVFPSLWLGCLAENVELEAALARSYNQFMATQCGESRGRLQYIAIVPWRRPDLAVQEIRRVKTAWQRSRHLRARHRVGSPADPSESLADLRGSRWARPARHGARGQRLQPDHQPHARRSATGHSIDEFPQIHPLGKGLISEPYVLYGFQQILGSSLLDDFPKLRVAFLEAGIDWVPRLVKALGESRRGQARSLARRARLCLLRPRRRSALCDQTSWATTLSSPPPIFPMGMRFARIN